MRRIEKKKVHPSQHHPVDAGTFFPKIQEKLAIGKVNDPYEKQADTMADKVVNQSIENTSIQKKGEEEESLQQKSLSESVTPLQKQESVEEESPVQKEEEEEAAQPKRENPLQRKENSQTTSKNVESGIKASKGQGGKMDYKIEAEMEKGIGTDFSDVNIHTDAKAQRMSHELGAQAFTTGNDIYFNEGKYNPDTQEGKHLLAHELTHTIQQTGGNEKKIQRKLSVQDDYPKEYADKFQKNPKGEDPSKKLSNNDRHNLVKGQLAKISPDFSVNGSGKVEGSPSKPEKELAESDKGTGSCCMHVLTRPSAKNDWEIVVADHFFPHTHPDEHKVLINSNLSPLELGAHSKKGEKQLYTSNPEIVLGHELCGHAALLEIEAHAKGQRAVSNLHDSTINIENEIAKSVGKTDDELRGLAADGPNEGESFAKSVVINFGFNKASVHKLDPSEQNKLKLIADLVKLSDMFVELRGHSDNVGTDVAKQHISDRRAKNVYHYLRNLGVSRKAKVEFKEKRFMSVNRFLLKGLSDKDPIPGYDPLTEQHKLRRVEIIVSPFPAGLSEITPDNAKWKKNLLAKHDKVKEPEKVQELIDKGTPCEKLLVEKAWRKK